MSTRVALVTGGTRGIGLGIARALAGDGWHLALCGVRARDEVRGVLDGLQATGIQAEYWPADVAVPADRARLLDAATERFGALHALVNNAGRAPRVRADLLAATEEDFADLLRTNLQGPYFLTQAFARRLIGAPELRNPGTPEPRNPGTSEPRNPGTPEPRNPGTPEPSAVIVFVTSISSELASPNRGDYCVSKAGLAMAVKLFALRLAEAGIPVYEVRPGIIATDMTAGVRETYDQRIADGLVPERRWGQPEDVGRAVAALLRGDVPYATGAVIHVDGGLSVPRL